jgi:hypothetical protein
VQRSALEQAIGDEDVFGLIGHEPLAGSGQQMDGRHQDQGPDDRRGE